MKTFPELVILPKVAATGYGVPQNVENFDHVALTLAGDNTAAFTIKVQASQQNTLPDFTAAPSPTNRWQYIQLRYLLDQSAVAGGTGVVFAANAVEQYEVNTFGIRWINVQVSSYTTGNAYAWMKAYAINEAA